MCKCHESQFLCEQGRLCPERMPAEFDEEFPPMTIIDTLKLASLMAATWGFLGFVIWLIWIR